MKSNIKKEYLIIFLLAFVFGYSQSNSNEGDKSYLPNVTPPSPESFAITEYGKNGVTEYTGKLNVGVSIYNYTAGQLSLPISLNYSGAGVKVNDISTWTGINWTLMAGGVINRKINDAPDESNQIERKFINLSHLLINGSNTCAPDSQQYYQMAYNGSYYDTEVDIFNFSFNGYSGSFYLDGNFNPVYLENENELKIEILGTQSTNVEKLRNEKTFLITTPDGVKYYFGNLESEITMVFSGHRGTSIAAATSFYLYKIQHPIKGEIILEYFTAPARLSHMSKSYSMQSTALITNNYVPGYTGQTFVTQINNPKRLSKIKSLDNNEEIIFNSTLYGSHHFISSLDNIEIKSNQTLLKKVSFTYGAKNSPNQLNNDFTTATRFFLEKIDINKDLDNTGHKFEQYTFEYNDPFGLPSRLFNGQDIMGYYNGANNLTLIPSHPLFDGTNSPSFANRNPNFNLATKGALTKVVYPTKGYSLFEYEPTSARKKKYKQYEGAVVGSEIITIPGYNGVIEEPVVFTPIYANQKAFFKIYTGVSESDDYIGSFVYQAHHAKKVKLTITDVTDSSNSKEFKRSFGMVPGQTIHEFDFIKDHLYTIKLEILSNDGSETFGLLNANFNLKLFDGYEKIDGFGVRIKKQSDYASSGSQAQNISRYYYSNINNLIESVERLPEINIMPKFTYYYKPEPNGTELTNAQMWGVYINVFSDPGNKYCNPSNNEFYDVVTTSFGGNNFENGGVEKYYLFNPNSLIERISVVNDGCRNTNMNDEGIVEYGEFCGPPSTANTGITFVRDNARSFEETDNGLMNGKLLGERYFKNINGQLYKIKETQYEYQILEDTNKKATNLIAKDLFGYQAVGVYCSSNFSGPMYMPLTACYLGYYFVNCYSSKLLSTKTKEYIEPIPMSLYQPMFDSQLDLFEIPDVDIEQIEQPFKKITTTQTYTYGALKGLPTEIQSSTSESNVFKKTVNTYLDNASSLSGLPSNQSGLYTSLLAQNRVSSPVQVQEFNNSELLSTVRTIYKNWTINSNSSILPEKIQVAKGDMSVNPLEDKAIFYNYDERFNPVVMGYKDAPKTRYIFNTMGLVVAKIENYTDTITSFPLIVGNIDNSDCALQNQYPNANVTVFTYNLITKKIVKITDPRCQDTYYEYDDLNRLKLIRDHQQFIVKEFDNNYKH